MIRMPSWAKKPVLRSGVVVATKQGWVHRVEGKRDELLVRVIDLPTKLAELKEQINLNRREVMKSLGSTEEVIGETASEATKATSPEPKTPASKPKPPAKPPAKKSVAKKTPARKTPARKATPKPAAK